MTEPLTIAVTGGTGFLGQHVVQYLRDAGHIVRALTRKPRTSEDDPSLTWVTGDLATPGALSTLAEGADVVVHMAGAIKAVSRAAFFEANRDGTVAMVNAARDQGVKKFVLVSSLAAQQPALSPYAASKRAGEFALEQAQGSMTPVILRPPAIYGPGDKETARLFQMATNGFVLAPAGSQTRVSLCHAEDVAGAVLACCETDQPQHPLEIDDGAENGHSWPELADAAGAAVGRQVRFIRLPAIFLWCAGFFGTCKGLLSRRPAMLTLGKAPELLHPDWVARGPRPLGWAPKWSSSNGFKNAVDWYSSQNVLKRYL